MAKLSKPPIPMKMYKHFAVVTVSLTAAIAMFADHDNREAMAEHIEEQREEAELRRASAERFGAPTLVRNDERTGGGSFGEDNTAYGAPPSTGRRSGGSSSNTDWTGGDFASSSSRSGRPAIIGVDQDYIDSLSEEEYQEFLASLPEETREGFDPREREAQRAALERESELRSGRRGS